MHFPWYFVNYFTLSSPHSIK